MFSISPCEDELGSDFFSTSLSAWLHEENETVIFLMGNYQVPFILFLAGNLQGTCNRANGEKVLSEEL